MYNPRHMHFTHFTTTLFLHYFLWFFHISLNSHSVKKSGVPPSLPNSPLSIYNVAMYKCVHLCNPYPSVLWKRKKQPLFIVYHLSARLSKKGIWSHCKHSTPMETYKWGDTHVATERREDVGIGGRGLRIIERRGWGVGCHVWVFVCQWVGWQLGELP